MSVACEAVWPTCEFWKGRADNIDNWKEAHRECIQGDEARLKKAMTRSDELIEEAIACDPRLARRPSWRRSIIGEFADAALVASGDDEPCFMRSRSGLQQWAAAGEPIRIVISTDANEVKADTPAAFIATARLVMQFAPLEIWWQGAWLTADGMMGYVFHVPLIQNDVDFSRLEFCIASDRRDSLSYCVALDKAHTEKMSFSNCSERASRSYLPHTRRFIDHEGITPAGSNVAHTAADWLGWEALYEVRWNESESAKAALQSLPEPEKPYKPPTAEERRESDRRWERYEREQAARKKQEAEQRMNNV